MSKDSTLKASETDWEAVEKMEDKDIDLSEIIQLIPIQFQYYIGNCAA